MELRDYYNINKERTGETYTADIKPTGDNYMLIVVSFMQNAEEKFLIQRASKEKYKYVNTFIGHNKIVDLYYIKEEIDVLNLSWQKEEVEEVKWMDVEEIEKLIEQGEFEKTHAKLFKDLQNWLIKNYVKKVR